MLFAGAHILSPISDMLEFVSVLLRVLGFTIFVLALSSCFRIDNLPVRYVGKISGALYLTHTFITYQLDVYISNVYVYILASFALSAIIAVGFNKVVTAAEGALAKFYK